MLNELIMNKILIAVSVFILCSGCSSTRLSLDSDNIQAHNRSVMNYKDSGKSGIELNALEGDGIAVFENTEFETGTIFIDIKGENNPGKSFVGLAFNITDEEGYEVVYFRPFNFVAKEQIRRDHMVQYVFHPEYTWRKLRTERTGEFEAEINDPPDPDNWFTALIKITRDRVMVFMRDEDKAVLDVPRLSAPKSGRIGAWVGHNSSGRFANVRLKKE